MANNSESVYVPIRIEPDTERLLQAVAAERNCTRSEVIRDYIDQGLKNQGYRPDDERLYKMITAAMQEILTPSVNRLAKISAKAAQIDGAVYFLLVYFLRAQLPPGSGQVVQDLAARARHLGAEYLKQQQDSDLDEFLQRGNTQMEQASE